MEQPRTPRYAMPSEPPYVIMRLLSPPSVPDDADEWAASFIHAAEEDGEQDQRP